MRSTGRKSIGQLTADDVQVFLDGLGVAPRTLNNWLRALRTLANFAKRRRYLPRQWDELDLLELYTEPPSPPCIYTPGEVRALLNAAGEPFRPVMLLTVFAGVRVAEALRLTWGDIDFERRIITVDAHRAKTRSRRVCPIQENLAAWLARRITRAPKLNHFIALPLRLGACVGERGLKLRFVFGSPFTALPHRVADVGVEVEE